MLRKFIAEVLAKYDEILEGEIESDESYFGGKRKRKLGRGAGHKTIVFGILERGGMVSVTIVKDVKAESLKRGRGAAGKVAVFGTLKRGGKVYTVVVEDTISSTLMPVITREIAPDSIVYTDTYKSYNALDVVSFHHQRINHLTHFAKGKNHINGIENFWNQAKRVLRKYTGIHTDSFPLLFLKECEFRFNYGTLKQQLETLRLWGDI